MSVPERISLGKDAIPASKIAGFCDAQYEMRAHIYLFPHAIVWNNIRHGDFGSFGQEQPYFHLEFLNEPKRLLLILTQGVDRSRPIIPVVKDICDRWRYFQDAARIYIIAIAGIRGSDGFYERLFHFKARHIKRKGLYRGVFL
jgi:hypothetical protein